MKPLSPEKEYQRWLDAANYLAPLGWRSIGGWIFEKNGRKYDLSAADIKQHKRIESERIFLVDK